MTTALQSESENILENVIKYNNIVFLYKSLDKTTFSDTSLIKVLQAKIKQTTRTISDVKLAKYIVGLGTKRTTHITKTQRHYPMQKKLNSYRDKPNWQKTKY